MRNRMLNVLVILVALAAVTAFVYPEDKPESKCCQGPACCCAMMKGADVKVANIDNGVTLTITSEKAEQVKALQEKAAACGKSCQMHQEKKSEKQGEKSEKACCMKDVTCKVANIDKGVTITMTSDKPEQVKAIQECAAKCSKGECNGEHADKGACCPQSKTGQKGKCCQGAAGTKTSK